MSGNLKYQKIIKVGNSLAVTLDRDFVTQTGVKHGDQVAVNYDSPHGVVSYAPIDENGKGKVSHTDAQRNELKARMVSAITPELEEWMTKFLEENKEALLKLANV